MWVDIHPGLCCIAMPVTINSGMPNTNSVWIIQIFAWEISWLPFCFISRAQNETVLCPAARTWWLCPGRSVGSSPKRDRVFQKCSSLPLCLKIKLSYSVMQGSTLQGAVPKLGFTSHAVFPGVFFLCFLLKPGRSRHPCRPGVHRCPSAPSLFQPGSACWALAECAASPRRDLEVPDSPRCGENQLPSA